MPCSLPKTQLKSTCATLWINYMCAIDNRQSAWLLKRELSPPGHQQMQMRSPASINQLDPAASDIMTDNKINPDHPHCFYNHKENLRSWRFSPCLHSYSSRHSLRTRKSPISQRFMKLLQGPIAETCYRNFLACSIVFQSTRQKMK